MGPEKCYKKNTRIVILYNLVDVILNEENSGFARGNNVGYQYAKHNYQPDFMIVMNNDVELVSDNFYQTLKDVFEEEQFFILSPDIYSTTYQLHQSPKRLKSYSKDEVQTLHDKFKQLQTESLSLKIKCYLKSNKWLRNIIYKKRVNQQGIDFSKRYYNVPLHGSCVIVSSLFINKEDELFLPDTFFYYEMEILDIICKQKGYKTIYAPDLQVHHHQNVSTNVVYNNMLKKTMFANKCNYESTAAFLKVFQDEK